MSDITVSSSNRKIVPYEISLWEDVLYFVVQRADGLITEFEGTIPDGTTGTVTAQYYKERKICTIGSDTMDTPVRAISGKLVTKVNGENTLTFDMYSHYYNEELDQLIENPFIKLLVNERKIKLRYGALGDENTKWYDFILKGIDENSSNKTYSYTAKDLFINELSKSGFNLEFDAELENNMGNIDTLAERILDESDWQLRPSGEILQQTNEEPLYQIQLAEQITATDMENSSNTITLAAGTIIYGFYNIIVNQTPYFQFLYAEGYEVDDDYVITNSPNWYIDGITYSDENLPSFASTMSISDVYRGRRLVRQTVIKYDPTIDRYVNVYMNGDQQVYGYADTEYTSPATVRSYITNPYAYDSYTGWEVGGATINGSVILPELEVVSVPDVRDVSYDAVADNDTVFYSCLKWTTTNTNQLLYNSGIVDNRQYIDGFTKGEKYVFRVKYGQQGRAGAHGASTIVDTNADLTLSVNQYTLTNGQYTLGKTYFSGTIASTATSSEPSYKYVIVECQESLSYAQMVEMTGSLGLFIRANAAGTLYIQSVEFFNYIDKDGTPLLPNEVMEGQTNTIYCYYVPDESYESEDDIVFIYKDYAPAPFTEVYNDNAYEKVRSITASESNRFNLLQELCEIFECWVKFEIEHNPNTGEILLDDNYRQKKWVSFHEYIGTDNYTGFKYGINLKSIQRTIDSDSIVSKLIVKNNSNEFADDGFCSIARASESPNGENFILDFSYYIQQGLLSMSEITNDLYTDINGFIGYYKKLKQLNVLRDKYINEQSGLITDITQYTAASQTYNLTVTESEKSLRDKISFVRALTGYTFEELMADKTNDWWDNDQLLSTISAIGRLKSVIAQNKELAAAADANLENAQAKYDKINRILTSEEENATEERLLVEKQKLNKAFYKKYSRFLQEGSWISEDYVDDNLYFLDAQSTLHTSSQPKVTYKIDVLELSRLDGYENYKFALGDKTTIEDTEFFGWVYKNGVRTPYREEIVVTELTITLDSPEQNQVKVQNYKTQFEDLFQRITATTQSVEFSTGEYNRASGIVETDGTINIVTLQNSIANNALTLQNAKDQTVIWDETGITTTSPSNIAEVVRIISGGIFLSVDGGLTWNTGITGRGINATYITSGQLNVEEVSILNGSFPSFRWNNLGISAYEFSTNSTTGAAQNFNYSKFVRLDQYGLYGINGYSNFDSSKADEEGVIGEDKIWKYSNFALTWRGFKIQSEHSVGGYISITSDNDFQVINALGNEQVKIGLLYTDGGEDASTPIYGIQLRDSEQNIVMEHSTDGKVWIKDELKVGSPASSVTIGYLKDTKATTYKNTIDYTGVTDDNIHQVINSNNKFIVYEDGSMKATDGEFTGIINAIGGKIGNMEISELLEGGYEVSIESDSGTVFKNGVGTKILTARLYRGNTEITEGITSYQWYRYSTAIDGATQKTLEVSASDLSTGTESAVYSCEINYNG